MEEAERTYTQVNISVRDLVEFVLRSGDIDTRSHNADSKAMQEGSRLHRKLQKAMGAGYSSEVTIKADYPVEYDNEAIMISIDGRADGVYSDMAPELGREVTYIDEIKTTYLDVKFMEEAVPVHKAQAMCYAYIYGSQHELEEIAIRMTYCQQETELVTYFYDYYKLEDLAEWFDKLLMGYAKWIAWQQKWIRRRDASISGVGFPFEYREGQRDLVAGVYRTISRKKRLFIEAPTGVGKTMSTVFPALRTMGEGKVSKIFYGTAKTIARTVAEEAFGILIDRGMKLKCVTITSKEKLCLLDKPECNPVKCPRAKGHFDRVNDAVYEMLTHEERIDRQLIIDYAEKFQVCPFEMCLDITTWSDAIICDYNYIFDPSVRLKRFFADGGKHDYCFLIDEAHNLVERAREMYSATIIKENVLAAKSAVKNVKKLANALEACNKSLLTMKRACDEFEVWEDCNTFLMALTRFVMIYDEVSKHLAPEQAEAVLDLYFDALHFIEMHDLIDDNYTICSDYTDHNEFRLQLQCMDPAKNLARCHNQAVSTIFFSATLLPVVYYREQLGGSEDDYCIYAPSPFDTSKRLLMVAGDVSTKYTRRTDDEFQKITDYLVSFIKAKRGNYLVFFPSYAVMERVAELADGRIEGLLMQGRNMTEAEKEDFLNAFTEEPDTRTAGFCVMGGIFSEGIDLKNDRLIGVAVVGTGLPQVGNERELFRGYFDSRNNMGFEYAYLYNGMNKVLQAAGRVIRTTEDVGAILLLDERFLNRQYLNLFPREWTDYRRVSLTSVGEELKAFWNKTGEGKL